MKTFVRVQDSINKAEKKQVSNTVDNIVQDKEKGFLQKLSRLQKILAIILFVFLCIAIYFLLKLKKQNNHKIKMDKLLHEKENKIAQHAEETQQLKQKVNESFEEVIYLAKTNSPEFFTRFQEVYPEYIEKLKEIYPEISIDDLRFCALLKLSFSTKDISEYTFVTIRTVQTRKSRLRKKFNIPSDNDIYLWMNELV